MTAEHESARGAEGAGEHGGMEALMAAITGDPLPADARRDPALLAEHRAAEADVAVLKEQLTWLAEALTGEPLTGEPLTGAAGERARAAQAPAPEADPAAPSPVQRPAGDRPRSVTRPSGPSRPPRPGRPPGRRRALRIALGTLAGVAAFTLALGFGRLVTGVGGGASDSGGDRKSAADAGGKAAREGSRPADPERELACSRLVVEGTVAKVARRPGSPWSRITLTVIRSYRPAHGPAEVGFLLDSTAEPAPRTGQHVLVRVARGEERASLWSVGDAQVAADRAWITEALPASRHTDCSWYEKPHG